MSNFGNFRNIHNTIEVLKSTLTNPATFLSYLIINSVNFPNFDITNFFAGKLTYESVDYKYTADT
jgi:hypothetical protein